jgi:hypothetical protein
MEPQLRMEHSTPASTTQVSVSLTTVIGENSQDPFPMIDRAWDVFASKGIRTVFFSIGNSESVAADLDIAEGLGCPAHVIPLSPKDSEKWAEVSRILKERKRDDTCVHSFSVGADKKWILPKNIRVLPALPWWSAGQLDLSDGPVKTEDCMKAITTACEAMKLKEGSVRIDILKIDTRSYAPGLEKAILGAILNAGFRPAVVLVHWSAKPDVDLSTTIAAGHLQNTGYRLISKLDNKFLYYFTDNDMYQICSWEDRSCMNPMCNAIASSLKQNVSKE